MLCDSVECNNSLIFSPGLHKFEMILQTGVWGYDVEEMNIVVTDFYGFRPVILTDNLNWNISSVMLMIFGERHLMYTTQQDIQVKKKLIFLYQQIITVNALHQRFSNFFQVGTTFISQNVLRTTLLLGLSNSLGLP